jgi:hypothetical protein
LETKYILSLKLLEFGLDLIKKNVFEALCPERIFILYFSINAPHNMKITKTATMKGGKDKAKLYQAPEVLVGQNESDVSYVWTFGVLIDLVFHERIYFEKFADILNKKGTFYFIHRNIQI